MKSAGLRITTEQFSDLMAALNMTRKEISQLQGFKITPQAVSSWRTEGSIPFGYANLLASKFLEQLKNRNTTMLDSRVLALFKDAKIL